MKCYVFVNAYCKGIQAGIQALHAVARLGVDADINYREWVRDHETVVLLNGGSHDDLLETFKSLNELDVKQSEFREEGLNDSLTAIAIVPNPMVAQAIEDIKWYRKNRYLVKDEHPKVESYLYQTHTKKNADLAIYLQSFRSHSG